MSHKAGETSAQTAKEMNEAEVANLCKYLHLAHSAWGTDPGYGRLWAALNNGLCMWLYRRMVLEGDSATKRSAVLNTEQFKKCLMTVSADAEFIDWLGGRVLTEFHRAPCYRRLKALFVARLTAEGFDKPRLPSPPWAAT